MAQYKVPQDVEADDKLLGPFSFRQFVYLLIAGGLTALAVGLFRLFPLLAIIPIPPIILFVILALPLKKDQPMETYLAALVSFYTKPRTRLWIPGQRNSIIKITAPKVVEANRTRNISGDEVNNRLSFLADIVDTEGNAIKGIGGNSIRDDLVAEASSATDIFEGYHFNNLTKAIQKDETERHNAIMKEMQDAVNAEKNSGNFIPSSMQRYAVETKNKEQLPLPETPASSSVSMSRVIQNSAINRVSKEGPTTDSPDMSNSSTFSLDPNMKQSNKTKEREGEVFISLH